MERRDELEDEGIPDLEPGPSEEQIETGDPLEGTVPPRSRASKPEQTTAEGQREGETLDERLAEEEPDRLPPSTEEPGQLTDDALEDGRDTEDELVAQDVGGQDENAPEDRAMRVQRDAPGGTSAPDSYVTPEDDEDR